MLRGCGLLVFYGLLLALVELVDGGGRRYWSGREVSGQRVVFSDIDGTIVHYKGGSHGFANAGIEVVEEDTHKMRSVLKRPKGDTRECILVPSSTMGNGHISTRTIELISGLRAKDVKFAYVSGARSTTMLKRVKILPAVDAVVCETGSCIFYPSETEPGEWVTDVEWRSCLSEAIGEPTTSPLPPPEDREGKLWDLYRDIKQRGLNVDARGYEASFRVVVRGDEDRAELENIRQSIEGGPLMCRSNLGHYDIFAAAAGKGNAVEYLQKKWGSTWQNSAAIFDDDNDLSMAQKCRKCFLPNLTAQSVQYAADNNRHWFRGVCCGEGVWASEEALEQLNNEVLWVQRNEGD